MDDVKNKMYHYESTPPEGVWEAIATELDRNEAKVIPLNKKKSYTYYYIAAASVAIILFSLIFFMNKSSSTDEKIFTSNDTPNDTVVDNLIMTVPVDEKTTASINDTAVLLSQNKSPKGGPNQKETNDTKEKYPADSHLIANNAPRYITIEGPQGQPVKISSKMATLIDSTETRIATKPIWNKKIDEWREIMKSNTLAPTPGNFLDIIELTKSLKDNK